jgi:type VI secretion system protein ImpH
MAAEGRMESAPLTGERARAESPLAAEPLVAPGERLADATAPDAPESALDGATVDGATVDGAAVDAARAKAEVLARFRAEPYSFEFFQAVSLLERLLPERAPVGGFNDPREEVVRFRTATSVAFPASEIQAVDEPRDGSGPSRMTVNFMGLTGPQGMLPLTYSLYLADRRRARDEAAKEFLGIFEHRMLSLFYRAWERSHAAVAHGRGQRDWLTRHLLNLVGLGTDGLRGHLAIPDEAMLFYVGLLGVPTRPAVALEQLLRDYFGVPAEIEQFVGAWYPLERATQCELDDDSPSAQLGLGAVAGDELWDLQSRVRIRLGPLTRSQYDRFLPGGSAHDQLRSVTRFFGNDQLDFEIQLVLGRDEVPACTLGGDGDSLPLGWSTWIKTVPFGRDADETTFTLSDVRA